MLPTQRGHSVRVIGEEENANASALTGPMLAQFDAVFDFTTPQAVIPNVRACLANGARVVVGTTGWYDKLNEIRAICERRNGALVYGANFSVGIQVMYQLARQLVPLVPGFEISISETHHEEQKGRALGNSVSHQAGFAGSAIPRSRSTSFPIVRATLWARTPSPPVWATM